MSEKGPDMNNTTEVEVQALLKELQGVSSAAESQVRQFAVLWNEIGIKESNRELRRTQIKDHILNLLGEMLEEEQNVKFKLENDIVTHREDLKKLSEQLREDYTQPSLGCSLLEAQDHLKQQADAMKKRRNEKQKRFKRLYEMESSLCRAIGEAPELFALYQAQAVPTAAEMQTYRERVEAMEKVKESRQTDFFIIREEILRLWSALDQKPESDFDVAIMRAADHMEFVLSQENMDKLAEMKHQLAEMDKELTEFIAGLRGSIISLWNRLEVEQKVQEAFMNSCTGPKPEIAEKFQYEFDRLTELKKVNMKQFIETTQKELVEVWDMCYYGPHQRQDFHPFFIEEYNEDSLGAHESELDRMKGFYRDHANVFKMIAKREDLWKKMLEAEARANDPNRFFHNRGGQLLKEEKLRKKVEKDLPKVEAELFKNLEDWEECHSRPFVIRDVRYIDSVGVQWRQFKDEKDQQKVMRLKAKAETTALEMTYGSVSNSPSKRKAPTATTPGHAPPKIRKVGPSPLMKSSKDCKANLRPTSRAKPPTGAKTPKKAANPRKILSDHNTCASIRPASNETVVYGQPDISLASTISTYSEFQKGFHVGIDTKTAARSSCVPRSSSSNTLENH